MAIVRVFTTLKTHKKKSIFFGIVASYCAKLLVDKYRISNIMRAYCLEATEYGEKHLKPFGSARHLTVILNPVARDRKAKANYESYVAPILNCAGIKVSVIQTEAEGQARELLEIMDSTDGVVIAGGSGTIHEAVTGLLRRKDKKVFPLGIVPVGKKNISAYHIHGLPANYLSERGKNVGNVEAVAAATMAVVRETLKKVDVLKIEAKGRSKEVYAVDALNLGSMRNMLLQSDGYWYFGPRMKPYLALVFKSLFKDWSVLKLPFNLEIKYTKPCGGCSKCFVKPEPEVEPAPVTLVLPNQSRWWQSFVKKPPPVPKAAKRPDVTPIEDFSTMVNEECGVWHSFPQDDMINLVLKNSVNQGKVEILAHKPNILTKGSFVIDGVNMFHGTPSEFVERIDAQKVHLRMSDSEELVKSKEKEAAVESDGKKKETRDETIWFSIDTENYEREDLDISLIPNVLPVYTN